MPIQHVLVTGGAGYIGSTLTEMLLSYGYEVTVLDRFFFGATLCDLEDHPKLHLVRGDIRTFEADLLNGIDAVLDLAAISNDPAGELDPDKTMAINYRGRARVCRMAKESGVQRYVLASSCSVYGFQNETLDETSSTSPLTTYAEANLEAEAATLPLDDATFTVTALRQATVYGKSRRMRFDLAINGMTLGLSQHGTIPVLRDGSQWRPMVHVRDTSEAFIRVLEADREAVAGQTFNVGSDDQNFQIMPLAQEVAAGMGVPFRYEWYGEPDHRSYQVSFAKIREQLEFEPVWRPDRAAREIHQAIQANELVPDDTTRTVTWYKQLLRFQQILGDVTMEGRVL